MEANGHPQEAQEEKLTSVSYDNHSVQLTKRMNKIFRNWNIQPIRTQLKNAIGRYRHQNRKLERIYPWTKGCGVNGCGNSNKSTCNRRFKRHRKWMLTLNKKRHLRNKMFFRLLYDFHRGLQTRQNCLRTIIKYENGSAFYNEERANLLYELKRDLRVLDLEVKSALEANGKYTVKNVAKDILPTPSSETDLTIQEWNVIQSTIKFLVQWKEILKELNLRREAEKKGGKKQSEQQSMTGPRPRKVEHHRSRNKLQKHFQATQSSIQ